MLSGWMRVSVFHNISVVARVKAGRTSGGDAMEAFRYYCFLLSSLFKELEKEGMDCMWINN